MRHVLVIGGTGMLYETSLWLSEQAECVSVIGRTKYKMDKLTCESSNINPIIVDYKNEKQLDKQVKKAVKEKGTIDVVVAWIHRVPRKDPLSVIINLMMEDDTGKWDLFHVVGSRSNLSDIKERINTPNQCIYHQVQLGFKLDEEGSRWLTHSEISNGVIEAITLKQYEYIVGTLEPWDKRP
ncbi:short-chain dehydrogenase [Alkalibacillus silvisoli]|uniref:Short-chain dehydrogenase n=1 Tax=Alkalibacillus silvisoli TaxID=392823 RepID=A0ABN0ZL54_9BACI